MRCAQVDRSRGSEAFRVLRAREKVESLRAERSHDRRNNNRTVFTPYKDGVQYIHTLPSMPQLQHTDPWKLSGINPSSSNEKLCIDRPESGQICVKWQGFTIDQQMGIQPPYCGESRWPLAYEAQSAGLAKKTARTTQMLSHPCDDMHI